ncbi:MAG TPA: aromatic amino acid transport family protein [Actinomycetota bacterium]|nr:aromatic amino acid transport family protein [Actinomycetota bacterium]
MPSDEPLFSRSELLGGLPARRASTVLFAIEARAAHLVARSRRAMAVHETERSSENRERAFLDALAGARELPLHPTIQDLERFAPKWADVAPKEPDLRAAIARLLGRKYTFTADRTPRLRTALGLDDPEVRATYKRLHGEDIEEIYGSELDPKERFKWARSDLVRRFEELPPFWTAYALALTEAVGAGILALPIALAGIGPLPGVIFLVVAGVLNLLTMGGLVEAITRTGRMRYGSAFFGRLAGGLLGRSGTGAITGTLFVFNVVIFLTYLIAFAAPLADATHLDPAVWVGALFVVNLIFLRRDLNATVASALVIGTVNVLLILIISIFALTHVDMGNLSFARIPLVGSDPANVAAIGLAFGVVIMAFFGHTSVGLVAKLVLEREPSGKALLRGSMAAMATVIVLYCFAVIAIQGAVSAPELADQRGTALEPLAQTVGPAITFFGAIYVVLAVGLVSIYTSLGMANQVREWLPGRMKGPTASLLSMVPTVVMFVVVELLLLLDQATFTQPLALIGTLAVPLLGGIFPMLLLASSRRRGDRVPATWVRLLRGPISMTVVALAFFVGLLVQGFVVWQRPPERVAAGLVAAVILGLTWMAVQRGSFRSRAVIELRREPSGRGEFAVLVDGRPEVVDVRIAEDSGERSMNEAAGEINRFAQLRTITFKLPSSPARELRIWVHGVTAEGDSEAIPSTVELVSHRDRGRHIDAPTGSVVVPLDGGAVELRILLEEAIG